MEIQNLAHPIVDQYTPLVKVDLETQYIPPVLRLRLDLSNPDSISNSLTAFLDSMNKGADSYMETYLKPDQEPIEGSFVFASKSGKSRNLWGFCREKDEDIHRDIQGYFYLDASHAISLGFQKPNTEFPCWLSVIAFESNPRQLAGYSLDLKRIYDNSLEILPIILQLQANRPWNYKDDKSKHKEATSILSKYRWEKALVELVMEWAHEERIRQFYMIPGQFIKWVAAQENPRHLKLRYDVTAKRSGFKLQENGLYCKYWYQM